MKTYKHYSFDLWSTLIKFHPQFKRHLADYFFRYHNASKYALHHILQIISEVDRAGTIINEVVGKNIDSFEMIGLILYKLDVPLHHVNLMVIYNEIEEIFLSYPPSLYDENTLFVLLALKDAGATLSILSNTGIIKGYTLDYLLSRLGIRDLFLFRLYSDEKGYSKPNPAFFDIMIDEINQRSSLNITGKDILHVGDNPVADFKGATDFGIDPMLINSNDKNIIHVLDPVSLHALSELRTA